MTTEQTDVLEIEFLEQTEEHVYDIEVKDNHNFFVYGYDTSASPVLVSNCIVPLEMTATQTMDRLMGILTGLEVNKISQKKLSSGEKKVVKDTYRQYVATLKQNNTRYTIYEPEEDVSIEEVLLTLKPHGYKVILIDYISLLKGADGDDQWRQLGNIARFAKVFAKNNNCFVGSEKFLTREHGNVAFQDVVGQKVTVLTRSGWEKAEVKAFGKQATQTVTFRPLHWHSAFGKFVKSGRSNLSHTVKCTPDHRWILADGSQTTNLKIGDSIPSTASTFKRTTRDYKEGLRHGLIFGDGTDEGFKPEKNHWSMRLPLCGEKASKYKSLFKYFRSPQANGDPIAIHYTDKSYKQLPEQGLSSDYYAGFLEGWIAADGHTDKNGSTWVSSQNEDALNWLVEHAPLGGLIATGKRFDTNMETNLGRRKSKLGYVTLKTADKVAWIVDSIIKSQAEHVYCAVVPKSKAFTLSNGLYTGNCIVVLLCQVSEEGKIRYAQAIAEHSNNAWIWTMPGEESETSIMDIRQIKARNQHRFNFQLLSNNLTMRITDLDEGDTDMNNPDEEDDGKPDEKKTHFRVNRNGKDRDKDEDGDEDETSRRKRKKKTTATAGGEDDEEGYVGDINEEHREDDEDGDEND